MSGKLFCLRKFIIRPKLARPDLQDPLIPSVFSKKKCIEGEGFLRADLVLFFSTVVTLFFLPLSAEQIAVNRFAAHERSAEPITVEFSAQPTRVVAGQELVGKLVVTYDPRRVSIRGLEIPKYADQAFNDPFEGPYREQVGGDGRQMVRLIWSVKLYPKKAGPLRLPGITVQYGQIKEQRGGFGDVFSWAFQQESQLELLTSQDLSITVDQVPVLVPVDAVGNYQSCTASIDRTSIKQGEAATFTIELIGIGNAGFEVSHAPVMPDGCTGYPESAKRTRDRAIFRSIIQCNQAGTVTIPAQKFSCYNPITKKNILITSQPVAITVISQERTRAAITAEIEPPEDQRDDQVQKNEHRPARAINWAGLLVLCFIFLLGLICWCLRKSIGQFLSMVLAVLRRKIALMRLCFSARFGKLPAGDAYQFFLAYTTHELSDSTWQDFWLHLQSYCFRGQPDTLLSPAESDQVRFWAKRLKKRIVPARTKIDYILGMLLIASISLLIYGLVQEYFGVTRRLSVDTPLYLGPGSGYPVSKELVAGDEVRVMRSAPERADVWKFVDAHGEKGWLPHDVFV